MSSRRTHGSQARAIANLARHFRGLAEVSERRKYKYLAANYHPKLIVRLTRTSFRLRPAEMATVYNTVGGLMTGMPHLTLSGYVGYSPSLSTVIVAHQGTNPSEMYASKLIKTRCL